jgi:hypothetical protein
MQLHFLILAILRVLNKIRHSSPSLSILIKYFSYYCAYYIKILIDVEKFMYYCCSRGRDVHMIKRRDLIRKLELVGYRRERNGDPSIYGAPGRNPVQIPNIWEIHENTAKQIFKAAGLIK